MHSVEALIASYEVTNEEKYLVTNEEKYLDRAVLIANQFANNFSSKSNGQIWEHYNTSWEVDWKYNQDKPDDTFRPWSF